MPTCGWDLLESRWRPLMPMTVCIAACAAGVYLLIDASPLMAARGRNPGPRNRAEGFQSRKHCGQESTVGGFTVLADIKKSKRLRGGSLRAWAGLNVVHQYWPKLSLAGH